VVHLDNYFENAKPIKLTGMMTESVYMKAAEWEDCRIEEGEGRVEDRGERRRGNLTTSKFVREFLFLFSPAVVTALSFSCVAHYVQLANQGQNPLNVAAESRYVQEK